MAIDASILAGLKPMQVESPTNALVQVLQAQHLRQSVDMGQRQADEYQRGLAGENKLAQLLSGGGTPDQVAAGLAQAGYGKQALAYTKQQQDMAKTGADISHLNAQTGDLKAKTATADYDLREKRRQQAVTDIASFTSAEQALTSLGLHEKAGDLTPDAAAAVRATIPQNPADFPKWQVGMLQRILSPENAIKQLAPDANTVANNATSAANNAATNATSRANTLSTNATSRANNAATVAATVRGQDMTDGRARDTLAQGKTPVGYRQGPDGTLVAIPGGPADPANKPLNDSQSKALLFGTRMQESNKILDELTAQGVTNSNPGSRNPYTGPLVNMFSSEKQQRLDQAKRDFLNATLRRESGAAISPGEFENGDKQYFPQIGDSPAVIQQKARNRDLASRGVLIEVPEKQRASLSPAAPAAAPQSKGLPKGWSVEVH